MSRIDMEGSSVSRSKFDDPCSSTSHPCSSVFRLSMSCRVNCSSLVFRDKAIEQPHAETGCAFCGKRPVLGRPRHAGDIEMSPRHRVNEALDELCCSDTAPGTIADILHIGGSRLDRLVVFIAERHPPERLARLPPGLEQFLRQLIVVREEP